MQGIIDDPVLKGIIPRINKQVFEKIENSQNSQTEFSVTVAMIEIYMEKIKVNL